MTPRYLVFLDVGSGGCMAHVLGRLLGCNQTARNRRRVLAKIRREVVSYSSWLRSRGERVPVPSSAADLAFEVVEEMDRQDPWIAGGTNALFSPEREPATPREVERCIRRMTWNREDLLALVRTIPRSHLLKQPANEPRSVTDTLTHIATCEIWYISRLGLDLDGVRLPKDPFRRLRAARRVAVASLRSLTPRERRQVFTPTLWCSERQLSVGEQWTARKVLRRLLEHERQHTQYLHRLLNSGALG